MKSLFDNTTFISKFAELYYSLAKEIGEDNAIASLQFAVTYKQGRSNNYQIMTYTKAHKDYYHILSEYINLKGSILFGERGKQKEKYAALTGDEKKEDVQEEETLFPSAKTESSEKFETWNDFLSQKKFGKFSIWLSLIDRSSSITDWEASIDIFLVLNTDISEQLPTSSAEFKNANPSEFDKWKKRNSIFYLLYGFADDYGIGIITKAINQDLERQSKKAAIVQYMARNLSHNTGSHLIPEAIEYFKQHLGNNIGENEMLKLREEFTYYQKYTQERMELLAQLSSMRENRNWTNYNIKEIFNEFNGSIIPRGLCDNLYNGNKNIAIELKDAENIFVALPDGAIGKQAFYVVLENFIRNVYKHSTPNNVDGQKRYPLNIKISAPIKSSEREDFWCIDIYDELGSSNKEARDEARLNAINDLIGLSVLINGQLREEGWGLLEMKSAVAFLQGDSLGKLDEFNPEFFKANYYDNNGDIEIIPTVKNLGCRFYLRKPKLLIIDSELATEKQNTEKAYLKSKGIIVSTIDANTLKEPHLFVITRKQLNYSNQKVLSENIDTSGGVTDIENLLWEQYICNTVWDITQIVGENSKVNGADKSETAYFDSHGCDLTLHNGSNLKTINKIQVDQLELGYYHPFKSRSNLKKLLEGRDDNVRFKGLLLESIQNKVLVVDERIQNLAEGKDNDQPSLHIKDIFSLIGVDIPEQNLSGYLELPDKEKGEALLNLIKDSKYKYVILHLTILEKLSGIKDKSELKKYILETIGEIENFDKQNRAFVLVSGRGVPPNIPNDTYYINYTTLYDALVYRMSKPHLMQTLITLRK